MPTLTGSGEAGRPERLWGQGQFLMELQCLEKVWEIPGVVPLIASVQLEQPALDDSKLRPIYGMLMPWMDGSLQDLWNARHSAPLDQTGSTFSEEEARLLVQPLVATMTQVHALDVAHRCVDSRTAQQTSRNDSTFLGC